MFKLEMRLFGLCIKLDLHIHKTPKNADKCNINNHEDRNTDNNEETPIYEDNQIDYLFDETKITQIANQFQKELDVNGIYDIPDTSDVPPRYENLSTDVEIITDEYEKEIEDIIEGRR